MVRMSIKTADMDQKIIQWEEAIDKDPVLRNDPVLLQAVVEFKRHKQINDKLWNEMEGNETIEDPKTGRMIANPVIAMYIKNQTSFLKTAQFIEDRTEHLVVNTDVKKTW
jgi:hypothetical protein